VLKLQLAKQLGALSLDLTLGVKERSVMVLVGESGSGKTTLLRLVAGLMHPDRGRIEVEGDLWFDSATRTALPAMDRSVGYVAQDYALFPHLSVAENVAFGLRAQGLAAQACTARVAIALERLAIRSLAVRRPHELSGGQQQRVAIARAIVLEPRLLLLDEPLSALDVQTRRAIRGTLRQLFSELSCTTLYVTHNPAEALALGERITVLEEGRVSQSGSRDDLMRLPRSSYVAEFLGVNLFTGAIVARGGDGGLRIALPEGELAVTVGSSAGDVSVVVHPREITLALERPVGTARNVFAGTVEEIVPEPPAGELVRVSLATTPPLIAEVTREAVEALGLRAGMRVFASFKAAGVVVLK
jgi:molybdate transport system ATP-binding protein